MGFVRRVGLAALLALAGCASTPDAADELQVELHAESQAELRTELQAEPQAHPQAELQAESQTIRDPMESLNRPVFSVNRKFDDYALRPVARGWKFITPAPMRRSITNVWRNFTFPQRFVSAMGQAEFRDAHVELARFLVNSTVGIGGLFDPATRFGLEKFEGDLGMMFARWGIPPGPFIMIPIMGPSTPRDTAGDVLAMALNPLLWVGVSMPPIGILFAINGRAEADDAIEASKEAALDYYVFVRDAFIQRRTRTEFVTLADDPLEDLYTLYEEEPVPLVYPLPCDPDRTPRTALGPDPPENC
jgi:ABC-type transporter lipoprotein component MlaA